MSKIEKKEKLLKEFLQDLTLIMNYPNEWFNNCQKCFDKYDKRLKND